VISIGDRAFEGCYNLLGINILSSVTNIANSAFENCTSLVSAYFLGNAPTMGTYVFNSCAPTFKVYYISGNTGFANPWYGYTTETFVPTPSILYGDVNNDTVVDNKDLVLFKRYFAGLITSFTNPASADVNNDGVVDNKDLVLVKRYFAGVIVEFPAQP